MADFRPYSQSELQNAAEAYGLDPAFVEAVYAVESSRGKDPNAMRARSVKRKRDTTMVRGPFQLEDDTTHDLIRKHKLGSVNVDDADTHLELAMRLMSDLKDQYGGDYTKMAQAYLGGPGGVKNTSAKDELGTTTAAYSNRIVAEMEKIRGAGAYEMPSGDRVTGDPSYAVVPDDSYSSPMPMSPYMHGADATGHSFGGSGGEGGDDLFGMGAHSLAGMRGEDTAGSWREMMEANSGRGSYSEPVVGFGIPDEMGGDMTAQEESPYANVEAMLAQWVNEEMDGRDYAVA